jgi:hypothetical protein
VATGAASVADFTVLIEGGSGPQPHPSFIGFFSAAAIDYGPRAVAGAREDVASSVHARLETCRRSINRDPPCAMA